MSVSSQASVAASRNRPQTRSEFEPDEQWKAETRQRIEGDMTEMVGEAQNARDTALGAAVDEETKSQILKDFEMSMRNIRWLAQEEFNRQLFDESSQRSRASGQQVDSNWSEAKQEQQRISEQIKKEEDEKRKEQEAISKEIEMEREEEEARQEEEEIQLEEVSVKERARLIEEEARRRQREADMRRREEELNHREAEAKLRDQSDRQRKAAENRRQRLEQQKLAEEQVRMDDEERQKAAQERSRKADLERQMKGEQRLRAIEEESRRQLQKQEETRRREAEARRLAEEAKSSRTEEEAAQKLPPLPLPANLHTSSTVQTSGTPEVNWRSIFNLQHPAPQPHIQQFGKELSKEQTMRIGDTRGRVVRATQSVLGKVIDITHGALTIGADLLDYVPIPGLAPAAHALLDIWDAFEKVQSNRFACLRLIERCASILLSVREEVVDAGHVVSESLKRPIRKLHESFADVLGLLQRQLDMPFLKRFVGRGRILQDIDHCDASLTEALWRLGFSVQIQTMKLLQSGQTSASNTFGAWKQRFTSKSKVRDSLEKLCRQQNLEDREQDFTELRRLLRVAVETTDDAELVEILQIGHDEMPEAMKTLEHTLENYNLSGTRKHPNSDDLDRKFMENGIEALRRLTSRQGALVELPSWTISRFEINLDR